MKLSVTSAAFVLAFAASVSAAPATYESALSKRDTAQINSAIAALNTFAEKRDTYSVDEIAKREYQIVTEVLSALNDTGLAPKIIQYFVDDSDLQPIVTKTFIALVKSGLVNLTTLFTALNESGLAVQVISDVLHYCEFYATIYKLALSEISNLAQKISQSLSSGTASSTSSSSAKRDISYHIDKRDDSSVVVNLMESLKNSGLASSVVKTLVTDERFLKYGASLIEKLFSSGALSISELVSALKNSGLVTTLFKEFFTVDTLKTVIVNALAAAQGNCGSSTSVATSTTNISIATSIGTTSAGTGGSTCKRKRRRSYNY